MKKGFTLVELLGVLIVLAVIAVIVFPLVNKTIKTNKEKLYNSQLEEIKSGAEKWAYANIEMLPVNDGESVTITLFELKKGGFLTLDIRNPITGELLPNDMVITITFKNNNFEINVDGNSGSDIDSEVNKNSPIIILNGNFIEYVEINGTYEEKGALAKDKDGNIIQDIQISYQLNGVEVPSIDTKEFNTYTAIYSATSNGYTSRITRTIVIRDTTAPDLIVPGTIELLKEELASFDLLEGVSATDNSGEDIKIETRGFDRLPTDKIIEYTACDSHNNCVTKRRLVKVVEEEVEPIVYKDNSGANSPELLDNMIPIKYDRSNWIYADIKKEWYDYDKKEWANAVVLNSGITKNVGDTITEEEIALWYVWIPRYTYTIFNGNNGSVNPLEIQIKFESGISSSGTVECADAVSGSGTSSETCIDTTNGSIKNGTSTYTHPAFTFGNQKLKGFWVGKFEVSGSTSQITIKPNVTSLRSQTVSSFFNAIQNMSTMYSLKGDSHMIKNMEWGAVAYLSHSKYGTCTNGECVEVGINNNNNYITGCGSKINSSSSSTCNKYNSEIGMFASTTQNIYGIYDMSGGAYDYVMGNMVNSNGLFYSSSSGFSDSPSNNNYDNYSYGTSNTTYERGKLGDATKETKNWYNDNAHLPYSSNSWIMRGAYGNGSGPSGVGLFSFGSYTGAAITIYSSRAVLCK